LMGGSSGDNKEIAGGSSCLGQLVIEQNRYE